MLAVYDFAVSRISFDFFTYLVLADLARREAGADRLHLLLVPADGDGFHPNVQYDLDQKRWRLRNLVIDGAGLLPACAGVMQAASRDHARTLIAAHDGPIHPKGYRVDAPVGHGHTGWLTMAANAGKDVQVLRASAQARTYAAQWLDARRGGRKAVALTLREASHNAQRNAEPEMWAEFARYLEGRGYFPFIMRDIETALEVAPSSFDGLAECPAAVFNLDLRLAFYEQTYLNLFVLNGPGGLCQVSRLPRFLMFAADPDQAALNSYYEAYGFGIGEGPIYLNRLQRYIWRMPSLAVLIEEFEAMEHRLDIHEAAGSPESDHDLDPAKRLPLPVIARHFFNARQWDMVDAVIADAQSRGEASGELAAIKADADAERAAFTGDEDAYRRGVAARADGRLNDAIALLQDVVDRRPSEIGPYVELGLAFEAAGRIRDAETLYRTAIARCVATAAIVYRLGCIAQGLGDFEDARACFEMLLAKTGEGDSGAVVQDVRRRLSELDNNNH